ncbi:MAG: hypothetical protein FJ390_04600 [Verrucomicrobia bacterium]|nr:hypothetical protein [Verrucomicrobiota bacterium]
MTTKKSKKSPAKKVISKKSAPKRPVAKVKKPAAKKISAQHFEDVLTKEALKLVDEAATLLRGGIKSSQKTTSKAREATHKKAHALLGKATRHLDDALKSGSSFLHKAISKL